MIDGRTVVSACVVTDFQIGGGFGYFVLIHRCTLVVSWSWDDVVVFNWSGCRDLKRKGLVE